MHNLYLWDIYIDHTSLWRYVLLLGRTWNKDKMLMVDCNVQSVVVDRMKFPVIEEIEK